MGYRKLVIGDKTYEYVIGKTFTKVRHEKEIAIHKNVDIGNSCIVGPQNVKNAILGLPVPLLRCEDHGVETTELAIDPYSYDIYGKTHYIINCPICLDNLAGDI